MASELARHRRHGRSYRLPPFLVTSRPSTSYVCDIQVRMTSGCWLIERLLFQLYNNIKIRSDIVDLIQLL
jgi:hypothetical protein